MGVLPSGGAGRGEGYPMNEETRLTLELEQARMRFTAGAGEFTGGPP